LLVNWFEWFGANLETPTFADPLQGIQCHRRTTNYEPIAEC
jgi:hypothetical protein